MHIFTRSVRRTTLALVLAVGAAALAACNDESGVVASIDPPDEEATQVAALSCTVQVARATVECDEATPASSGARRTVMFGKQGDYVKLFSTGAFYDEPNELFSVDVTVQNLLSQPMGTSDGTTVDGVRVFFPSGPVVTGGTGNVSVANPDGTGTFTASNQPYFEYAQILAPDEISAIKEWQFDVDDTVDTFTFLVYVHTSLPHEAGRARWVRLRGLVGSERDFQGVWASAPNNVYVPDASGVWHYDGTEWRRTAIPSTTLYAIWGSGSYDAWVVGNNGKAFRFDGRYWNQVATGTGSHLYSIWGASADSLYAVGTAGAIRFFDGTTWTGMASGSSAVLYGVWGTSPDTVYAVGNGGTILRMAGGTWSAMTSGTTRRLWAVWGSGRDDVFAVGDSGTVLHYDGTGWSPMSSGTTEDLYAVKGRDSADVYAAGNAHVVIHYDGTGWTETPAPDLIDQSGGGQDLYDIWLSPGAEYVVGTHNTLLTEGAGIWNVESGRVSGLSGVWASSPSDVFVGGTEEILHFNGTTWTSASTPGFTTLDVWGSSPSDVFAVGEHGKIFHYDGTSWTQMTSPPGVGPTDHLRGVWGSGPSDVWAVGDADPFDVCLILHYDGSTWTHLPGLECQDLVDVSGTGPSNVFAISSERVYCYNGTTWARDLSLPTTPGLQGVFALNPTNVYLAGGGGIRHFNGTSWSLVYVGGGTRAITATSPHNVVAVGAARSIIQKTPGGWTVMDSGTDQILRSVTPAGNVEMYAVGGSGTIVHGRP